MVAVVAGLLLVGVHILRNDPASLTAGVFLVTLGLFIDRLDELVIGPLKAKITREIAQELSERLPAAPEASPGSEVQEAPLADRTIRRGPAPSAVGQAGASVVRPEDIRAARDPNELADLLVSYVDAPRKSRKRAAAEAAAFDALFDLQKERYQAHYLGEKTPDEDEAADLIEVLWAHTEDLNDKELARLTQLLRQLRERDRGLGIG